MRSWALWVLFIAGCCGCSSMKKPTPLIPSLAAVSVPLSKTAGAIDSAKIRLASGDMSGVGDALRTASDHVAATAVALAAKEAETQSLADRLVKYEGLIADQKAELHQVAKERDIIPYLVGFLLAFYFVSLIEAVPVMPQYRLYLKMGAFVIGFGGGYGAGRLLVRSISNFLP